MTELYDAIQGMQAYWPRLAVGAVIWLCGYAAGRMS